MYSQKQCMNVCVYKGVLVKCSHTHITRRQEGGGQCRIIFYAHRSVFLNCNKCVGHSSHTATHKNTAHAQKTQNPLTSHTYVTASGGAVVGWRLCVLLGVAHQIGRDRWARVTPWLTHIWTMFTIFASSKRTKHKPNNNTMYRERCYVICSLYVFMYSVRLALVRRGYYYTTLANDQCCGNNMRSIWK